MEIKPLLKWIGGKSQLMHYIHKYIPEEINNYIEPFVGGGSILFYVLQLREKNEIIIRNQINAYDINENLINFYNHVKNNKEELYNYVMKYKEEYDKIETNEVNRDAITIEEAKTSKESFYYYMRYLFNHVIERGEVAHSALFLFLNKTCWRGVYRTNRSGYFNVPFGNYKKTPKMISKEDLQKVSYLIRDVNFITQDFTKSIVNIEKNDFIVVDPPYIPLTKTSFVSYYVDGFTHETHLKLFSILKEINWESKFVLFNSKVEEILNMFKENRFSIEEIDAKRRIHSKNPNSTSKEVIICNYVRN